MSILYLLSLAFSAAAVVDAFRRERYMWLWIIFISRGARVDAIPATAIDFFQSNLHRKLAVG
jgi:hypothetical protein